MKVLNRCRYFATLAIVHYSLAEPNWAFAALSPAAIAGIVIGCLAGVAILIGIIGVVVVKYKEKKRLRATVNIDVGEI